MENKTLPRAERLRGDKAIQKLFSEGRSGFIYPFRYFYGSGNSSAIPAAILVSVPKKSFKRAVKRNLLKRRIREAYRLNKEMQNAAPQTTLDGTNIAFIYAAKEVLDFKTVESGVKRILSAIHKESVSASPKKPEKDKPV